MSKFIDLFCLSVYRETLGVDPALRESLTNIILENEARTPAAADQESAWLGDTAGHEFLFQETAFEPLCQPRGTTHLRTRPRSVTSQLRLLPAKA